MNTAPWKTKNRGKVTLPIARIRRSGTGGYQLDADEAAAKLIWLALRNITKEWAMPVFHWKAAMVQFAIQFGERFTKRMA